MMRSRLAATAVALLLLLSACESDPFGLSDKRIGAPDNRPWVKSEISQEQRQRDVRDCLRTAEAQVRRDATIDSDIEGDSAGAGAAQGSESLLQSMQGYGYKQRRQRLFDRCMAEKGYRRE